MFSEPAIGRNFFGRDKILKLLTKRVSDLRDGYRQNMALTGQSLSGKSSILQHFLYTITDSFYIPIYVEMIKEGFPSFAIKFIATLLYNALKLQGEEVKDDLNDLLEKAKRILPKTVHAIKSILASIEKREFDEAYLDLLKLTSTVKEETAKPCIVILDEFHNLENFKLKNPFLNFGKVIMIQKDTMYIVSSSRSFAIRKILSEKLALLFGNFEIIEVSGFDFKMATTFIEQRLSPVEMDNGLKRFLVGLTEGNPFYLEYICAKARETALTRPSSLVDRDCLEEAILNLIYNSNGTIHQYLMNFILDSLDTRSRESCLSVLTAIANGSNKLRDISRSIKKNYSDISKLLGKLSELGLISKKGVFYKIDDSVLEFWLKHVYFKKQSTLINQSPDKFRFFKEDISSYVSCFLQDAQKSIATRIQELFDLFSNESIQHEDKPLLLSHFTKVELRTFDDIRPYIYASVKDKCWICQIYENRVEENDIAECLKNTKSLKQKIARSVIVPLSGIDENAKLLAKELKMSIWGLRFINTLMVLYGKNRAVIL